MGDKPKAPERIYIDKEWLEEGNGRWTEGRFYAADIEYTRSDLYPATPEAIGELVEAAQRVLVARGEFVSHRDGSEAFAIRVGVLDDLRRALAAITAKEPR